MQIDQLKEGSTLTMKVSGRLDTMTAPQLESEITGHLPTWNIFPAPD